MMYCLYFNTYWNQLDICGRSNSSVSCLNSGSMFDVEILSKDCRWKSIRFERSLVLLMFIIENVCSQMYADPNRTSSFMAIFLRLTNLDAFSDA